MKMSSELLKKEEEYRKMNERIELQSKELMREFQSVLKKQEDILHETALKTEISYLYNSNLSKSSGQKKAPSKMDFEATSEIDIDPAIVPKSVDEMGAKGISYFYKAKIKAMQTDVEKLQIEYKMKADELRNIVNENKRLAEEKERWFSTSNSGKSQIHKLENQISTLSSKLQAKESENSSLKKEIEQVKKELKNVTQSSSSNEVKINRLLEENEKFKSTLQNVKREENDLKMQHRKQIDELTAVLKNVEKQKFEVLNAFKKQILLIDNLKRQRALYESQKLADIADKEFMKVLELNGRNQS